MCGEGDAVAELALCISEPFSSPAWGSNFVVFTSETGMTVPEDLSKAYLNRAVKYAEHHGVYLVPERFMLLNYHCMCLISPAGEVLGAGKAVYLNPANRMGKRSSQIEVLATEFGGVFLCVDVDVYHPQVCRIASEMGANIIVSSQHLSKAEYGSHLVVCGCWGASQLNGAYVIAVSGPFHCVCAPVPVSARGDGFVVPPSLKLPMTARIHVDKLSHVPKRPGLARKFYAIHREELLR